MSKQALFPEKLYLDQDPADTKSRLSSRIYTLLSSVSDARQYKNSEIEVSAHRAIRTEIDRASEVAQASYWAQSYLADQALGSTVEKV